MKSKKMSFQEWLDQNFDIKPWTPQIEGEGPIDCYVSKLDGSYGAFVSQAKDLRWLWESGITHELQSASDHTHDTNKGTISLGFNPEKQEWFGWSHRASYGFGVGSICQMGDVGYEANNREDFKTATIHSYNNDMYKLVGFKETTYPAHAGIRITYRILPMPDEKASEVNEKVHTAFVPYPQRWGKGMWTAETLDQAKQMARDFARNVS